MTLPLPSTANVSSVSRKRSQEAQPFHLGFIICGVITAISIYGFPFSEYCQVRSQRDSAFTDWLLSLSNECSHFLNVFSHLDHLCSLTINKSNSRSQTESMFTWSLLPSARMFWLLCLYNKVSSFIIVLPTMVFLSWIFVSSLFCQLLK